MQNYFMTGSHLKAIRKYLKLNQSDFAKKLDIKQSYYSELESGKKEIPEKLAEKVNNVGVPSDKLEQIISNNIANNYVGGAVGDTDKSIQSIRRFKPYFFYNNLTDKDLDFELSLEIEELKDAFDDYKKLVEALHRLNPPDFLIEKFTIPEDFNIYMQKIEADFNEEHNHLKDQKKRKVLKIVDLYQSDRDHIRFLISNLIRYIHQYVDLILANNIRKNKNN